MAFPCVAYAIPPCHKCSDKPSNLAKATTLRQEGVSCRGRAPGARRGVRERGAPFAALTQFFPGGERPAGGIASERTHTLGGDAWESHDNAGA
ncbi:hypothetical protein CDAR_385111 [Caerostris darwini]|uniref:Uncharacterized protein n=1 Tax=Caerostris darwini TaxID=1538125 RepID=A0AAV4WEC3_9ARAC|nr:hypothetical protein CDAR_385111 [Caerostris darwini]